MPVANENVAKAIRTLDKIADIEMQTVDVHMLKGLVVQHVPILTTLQRLQNHADPRLASLAVKVHSKIAAPDVELAGVVDEVTQQQQEEEEERRQRR